MVSRNGLLTDLMKIGVLLVKRLRQHVEPLSVSLRVKRVKLERFDYEDVSFTHGELEMFARL